MEPKIAPPVTFPPFPSAPPGVDIIPFKDFKGHGIDVERDEFGREIDRLGVRTAILPTQEEPDWDFEWEPHHEQRATPLHESGRKQWWEYWSEFDNKGRPFAFNTYVLEIEPLSIS
jgi:hypothetical protein